MAYCRTSILHTGGGSCRMSVFKCYETDTWHTGHLHDGIKRGAYSRDDLLNRPRRDQS